MTFMTATYRDSPDWSRVCESKSLTVDLPIESERKLECIDQCIENLKERKLQGAFDTPEKRANLNETLFQCAKNLFELRQQTTDEYYLFIIKQLNNRIRELNPHIPELSYLVKFFGPESLKETLHATVSSFCSSTDLSDFSSSSNLDLEHLLDYDATEIQAMHVQRLIKAQRIGMSLSTVEKIERTCQEMIASQQERSIEKKIDDYSVVFIPCPRTGKVNPYIRKNLISKGSFKAAFKATTFDEMGTPESSFEKVVILQPKSPLKNESPAFGDNVTSDTETISSFSSSRLPVANLDNTLKTEVYFGEQFQEPAVIDIRSSQQENSSEILSIHIPSSMFEVSPLNPKKALASRQFNQIENHSVKAGKKIITQKDLEKKRANKEAQERYRREAQLCMELRDLPGIWPTYQTTEVNGNVTIIQKAAGYKVITLEDKEEMVIELADMRALAKNNRLDLRQQIVYLNMIGDFLTGVKSLHDRGLIHRDLKPANILCERTGRAGVSDLGGTCLEKIIDENGTFLSNPDKKTIIGTALYLCPSMLSQAFREGGSETAEVNWNEVTTKVDIWAAGLILWELFFETGKVNSHPALRELSELESMPLIYHLIQLSRDPKSYNENFPEPLNTDSLLHLIWECGRIDPAHRPNAETLVTKYHSWSRQAQKKLEEGKETSVHAIFAKELEEYER